MGGSSPTPEKRSHPEQHDKGSGIPVDRLAWRRERFEQLQKLWQDKMTGNDKEPQ